MFCLCECICAFLPYAVSCTNQGFKLRGAPSALTVSSITFPAFAIAVPLCGSFVNAAFTLYYSYGLGVRRYLALRTAQHSVALGGITTEILELQRCRSTAVREALEKGIVVITVELPTARYTSAAASTTTSSASAHPPSSFVVFHRLRRPVLLH